ncbi:dioxygenase family protein [Alicyclobacillus mengziensis]|uniref:Dioxygenase n=1 Tax=Alicyclobacillus mengziensis TaxID=2931921 RepID=A0A9X7W089_9BACL|nr:class III extradiol ring-cleavage dioxygenase [Alicyclobacillus mengziensis]QSO48052.1 dioxygenase [Alicyclobacillus mengziensis]
MLPSLFIAHGAPLLAAQENEYTAFLNHLGRTLERPKAIVLFSAHWESQVQRVSEMQDVYDTIYDFGGFPPELYEIKYPAKGAPELAKQVKDLLRGQGIAVQTDFQRGLDHGAWVVLRLLYPNADIPVVSMSVSPGLEPIHQYRVGQALSTLREQGVLIIGSGGTVHNLRALRMHGGFEQVDEWAADFDSWLQDHLTTWDLDSLYEYDQLAPGARMAVPDFGNEHFVPLFYAMGAADDSRKAELLYRDYQYGNLSHSVWQFG